MTRRTVFRLQNALLIANFISNFFGVLVTIAITRQQGDFTPPDVEALYRQVSSVFLPLSFIAPLALTVWYEQPIRRYIKRLYVGETIGRQEKNKALSRLLNEPFFLIGLDLAVWLAAACIYSGTFLIHEVDGYIVLQAFFISVYTGLITTTIAFFVFEFVMQRRIAPDLFPNGGLYMTPGTRRVRIGARLVAFMFAVNLIPLLVIAGQTMGILGAGSSRLEYLEAMRAGIMIHSLWFIGVGAWVTFLVSHNFTRPIKEIIRVLKGVSDGLFDNRVKVTSNDEIGYTGDVINDMCRGLKEREIIKETFGRYVAKEVRDEVLAGRIPLDGEVKNVTVLFADLRDFTPLTERSDPKLMVRMLNGYFEEMAGAVREEGGLILQFLGDEIYAVFGAPIPLPDHPARAFRAGLEMCRRLDGLNERFVQSGMPKLAHGIGIHTGDVLAANIGSHDRMSYLLVGDTVNLASRLQTLTKELGETLIVSDETRAQVGGVGSSASRLRPLEPVRIKGKEKPVSVWAALGTQI